MLLRKNAKEQLLRDVPLFSRCSKRELSALAAVADELDVPAGAELTREGELGREFVVIVRGAAKVTRNGRTLNRLGSGDFLGEIALLAGGTRTATVTTTEPTTILVLTDRAFRRVARAIPTVNASLLEALGERLQRTAL
ncbi:MAG TPA: cyclic nucleotide-binding domain-containing protein [Gaiellaceae bacterium]|nr:cyclic nucleotide-binding domain-containing protein [Gaiellaceae bacterium]